MFKYSAFIRKNTQELRDKLEELGKRNVDFYVDSEECLITNNDIFAIFPISQLNNLYKESIDCGTNEEAFLAIAAINDDTDKNQWFIMNGYIFEYSEETVLLKDHWYFCDNDNIKDCFELLPGDNINIRKATPDEILNRLDEN